jgi:hypothetical protein
LLETRNKPYTSTLAIIKNQKTMKQTLFLLIFLSALISNAQLKEKFEKGSIIKNNNLKTEGYIKADDLSKLSSSICFKRNLEEKKCKNYDTTQLKSFQTGNEKTFDLLNLKMNNNQNEINIFANLILKGEKLSLYKSVYNSEIFYIISKNDKNYVLQNNKLISGETEIRKYNYRGILNFMTEGLAFKKKLKIKFDEDNFVDIISEYNNSKGIQSKDLRVKQKSTNYVIANVGLGLENNGSEYYGQIMYRKYQPKISRSTSLNIGISYFNYQFKERNEDFTKSLLSIPLQIQQNFSNKNIRPYFFAGLSLNYLQIKDKNNNSILSEGLLKTYRINLLYGAGIEIDIYKGIYLKSEYRNESYSHPIVFGIGYIFENK